MTAEWIRSGLDLLLIALVSVGLIQATRLIWHLAGLRASRAEMEKFVREFNTTVLRAEAGIKNLKTVARESGDDLEKLVEKSVLVRDELHYLVDSADQLADRLTSAATTASVVNRAEQKPAETKPAVGAMSAAVAPTPSPAAETKPLPEVPKSADVMPLTARRDFEAKPASRAEKELMQALQQLN